MPFRMQTQEKNQWCWAAVAVSVRRYFEPFSTWNQTALATKVVSPTIAPGATYNNPDALNQPAKLQVALKEVGNLRETLARRLTFDELQRELDAGRPVCLRIAWDGGGAHFVVISGYQVSTSGFRTVDVSDSLYPDSAREFDEFPSEYQVGGEWTATYLVTE
jgi:Papain-like cysteine protease AvrRpt2